MDFKVLSYRADHRKFTLMQAYKGKVYDTHL